MFALSFLNKEYLVCFFKHVIIELILNHKKSERKPD